MAFNPPTASRYRDRVRLERRTNVSDGAGGTTRAWETVAEGIAASIEDEKGGESVQAQRLQSVHAVNVTMRATTDFTVLASDRLVNERSGETLSIKWVGKLDEMNRIVSIKATIGEVAD